MVGTSKILTVSYGTFSCTLEGFDDPFATMRGIAEYFRDLAAEDRYFGAEPPTPDAEMLQRIAEREIQRRVIARVGDNGLTLTQARDGDDGDADEGDDRAAPADDAAEGRGSDRQDRRRRLDRGLARARAEAAPTQGSAPAPQPTPSAPPPAAALTAPSAPAAPAPRTAPAPAQDESIAARMLRIRNAVAQADRGYDDGAGEAFFATRPIAAAFQPAAPAPTPAPAPEAEEPAETAAEAPARDTPPLPVHSGIDIASEGETLEPEQDDVEDTAPSQRPPRLVRARVVRMRRNRRAARAELDEAEDRGQDDDASRATVVEEITEESLFEETVEAEGAAGTGHADDSLDYSDDSDSIEERDDDTDSEDEDRVTVAAFSLGSTLSEEDEADLMRELAALQAEAAAETVGATADAMDTVEPEAAEPGAVAAETEAELAEASGEDDRLTAAIASAMAEDADADAETDAETDAEEADADHPAPVETMDAAALDRHFDGDLDGDLDDDQQDELEDATEAEAEAADAPAPTAPVLTPIFTRAEAEDEDDDEDEEDEDDEDDDDRRAGRSFLNAAYAGDDDASVSRILAETNSKLDDSEASRRRSTIAHLKAAVAATRADRADRDEDAPAAEGERDEDIDRYRDDLDRVVRPRRPGERTPATTRRLAPLMLVSEQRIDLPRAEPAEAAPVRPRRITAGNLALMEDEPEVEADEPVAAEAGRIADSTTFAEYIERMNARELPDLLEAAAAYAAFVEGRPHFSRPQLMRRAQDYGQGFGREDGLRAFGTLLRTGRIVKQKRGQFSIARSSRFHPE